MEVVSFVFELWTALSNLKVMYDQHVENENEIKELQSFIQDYDHQIPFLRERFQEGGGNVIGNAAFKNLEEDVMEATYKLEKWARNKSFFRVFNSSERMQKLGKLHSKVMESVQKNLVITNLSMHLDMQASQATILESNAELKSLLITIIGSMQGSLPVEVRDEVVEARTSPFADSKFWEDILSIVDNHNAGISSLEETNMYEDPITTNLMIDPVVASDGNTYCRWTIIDHNLTSNPFNVDEGLTIVIDNLSFRRGLFEKFPEQAQIFQQRRREYRSHAFSLRAQGLLGDAALALHHVLQWEKRDVECSEALAHVQGALKEAKEKYLQPFVGLSVEPSNKDQSGLSKSSKSSEFGGSSKSSTLSGLSGSSMHEMVVGTRIDLNEAYKLFPSLSSSIQEVRQGAAYGICQWSKRDVKFQSYIVKKGGISIMASILPSSNQITQELILSILSDISESSHTRRTIFGSIKFDFQDVLEAISKVLRKGSDKAHEHAARILFNLSMSAKKKKTIGKSQAMYVLLTSLGDESLQVQNIVNNTLINLFPNALEPTTKVLREGSTKAREEVAKIFFNLSLSPSRRSVIGKSTTIRALVTSLGDGSIQVQQIVSSTLNNLFCDMSTKIQAIKGGLIPILLKLIIEQPTTMLEEALPLVNELLNFWYCVESRRIIKAKARATIWLEIIASGSPLNQKRAASILYTLCYDDLKYRQQVQKCDVLQQISQESTFCSNTKSQLFELLNSNIANKHFPTGREIPFPEKDWWSP